MPDDSLRDAEIVASWRRNAVPWTAAVRESRIESRMLVTNQAIVDAVLSRAPSSVLDIAVAKGGWYVRSRNMVFIVACGDLPYVDGWRPGSWSLPNAGSCDPAPRYFRTTETWVRMLTDSGLRVVEVREPLHPTSQKPASVIFIATKSG